MITEINVIGAGGSGSFLLAHLARFLKGHEITLPVKVFDGDRYEHQGNSLRAPIVAATDMGRYKAETLCHRLNLIYGLNLFEPRNEYFDTACHSILAKTLLITCVDTLSFRQSLARHVQHREPSIFWCDLGNGLDFGQALLGWDQTTWPHHQWPNFWNEKDDPNPPCTQAPFAIQGPLVNPMSALAAMMLLEPMLLNQKPNHKAAFFGSFGLRLQFV